MIDPRPLRGRPRTMNTDAVLQVAVAAYWRGDPADVSMNAICQMAGVSKPSVYREFGNEDGLACAALNSYAAQVLADVFALLQADRALRDTLDALIEFASSDPRMETGCLFYKMRAGKHRLGPQTRALVDEIDATARAAFAALLQARREAGDWTGNLPADTGAHYLMAQLALAVTQRAAGEDPARIRQTMQLALSVFSQAHTS